MIDLRQTLETNLGLILTPRIDLSLKILAMNTIEIEEQLKEIVETNPLVKIDDGTLVKKQALITDKTKEIDDAFKERFTSDENSTSDIIEATAKSSESLEMSLLRQLKFEIDLDKNSEEIAKQIVFNLNEKGYLGIETQTISKNLSVPIELVEYIRKRITLLEPLGCGCLNYKEFVILQAKEDDENFVPALEKLLEAIDETNKLDIEKIKLFSNLDEQTFKKAMEKLKNYSLYPLENYYPIENEDYIQPDVYVKYVGNDLVAILEDRYANNISIDEKMLEDYLNDSSTREFIQEKYRQIKEFMLAITNRNKTLLKTVNIILDKQKRFFKEGILMPLTRKEIAEELGFNVSTITRTVANKYLDFEGKIIPLSAFFSSGLSENVSKEYVKSLIKEMIEKENKTNPLSDDQIREILKSKGIELTRRTVTKYRKEMKIPSSRERK